MKKVKKSNTPPKKRTKKGKRKVINWSEYNNALVERGNIEFWVDEETLKAWKEKLDGSKGRPKKFSNQAIILTLQLGKVYRQKLRQTEGLVRSLFTVMKLELVVPDYTTLSRRAENLDIDIGSTVENVRAIIIDSTGLKMYGEGEWKVRKHGYSKHRMWHKYHVAISPDGQIQAVELTDNSNNGGTIAVKILKKIDHTIDAFYGDGAYDQRKVYDACREKEVSIFAIPPQKNAKIWQHGNCKIPPHPRDENLRAIRKSTKNSWKEKIGYHTRSLVETTMFRYKRTFGHDMEARNKENQQTEIYLKSRILNKMWQLGMPETVSAT